MRKRRILSARSNPLRRLAVGLALTALAGFTVISCSSSNHTKIFREVAACLRGGDSSALTSQRILLANTSFYDRKTIFDFIDGEADIFLEYGFENLMASEVESEESGKLAVDIYAMSAPLDALGIFSVRNFDGDRAGAPGVEYCRVGSSIEFWRGRFFVRVYSVTSGDPMETALAVDQCLRSSLRRGDAARGLQAHEDWMPGDLPPFLRDESVIPHTVALAEGPLALRLLAPPVDRLADLLGRWRRAFTFQVKADDDTINLFLVEFASPEDAADSFAALKGSRVVETPAEVKTSRATGGEASPAELRAFQLETEEGSWQVILGGARILWAETVLGGSVPGIFKHVLEQ